MLLFQMHTSVQFHVASKSTKLPTHQVRQKLVHPKRPCSDHKNILTHGNNSVIMNLFSIEIVYLSQKLLSVSLSEYSVIKREF